VAAAGRARCPPPSRFAGLIPVSQSPVHLPRSPPLSISPGPRPGAGGTAWHSPGAGGGRAALWRRRGGPAVPRPPASPALSRFCNAQSVSPGLCQGPGAQRGLVRVPAVAGRVAGPRLPASSALSRFRKALCISPAPRRGAAPSLPPRSPFAPCTLFPAPVYLPGPPPRDRGHREALPGCRRRTGDYMAAHFTGLNPVSQSPVRLPRSPPGGRPQPSAPVPVRSLHALPRPCLSPPAPAGGRGRSGALSGCLRRTGGFAARRGATSFPPRPGAGGTARGIVRLPAGGRPRPPPGTFFQITLHIKIPAADNLIRIIGARRGLWVGLGKEGR
jgi:hypothetical protein